MSLKRKIARLYAPLAALACLSGCAMYPRFFDSPEFQKAAVDAFRDSVKSMSFKGEINNPGFEVTVGYTMKFALTDIHADLQGQIASGEQPPE